MATYVISDIHGRYDKLNKLLQIIGLKDTDTLYILGDVLDRGKQPITTIRKLMEMPNVVCILGNHELMALPCLEFLMQEITGASVDRLDEDMIEQLQVWQWNGSQSTIEEFGQLDMAGKKAVIEFIKDFEIYAEVTAGGRKYLLVHAGLGDFSPEKKMEDYTLHELVWERVDYETQYFEDVYVVTGHTPTQLIEGNPNPGYIYRHDHHIAIDCGACFRGGRLAAICLDTGEEFYA